MPRIYPNGPEEYERAANFLLHCAPLAEKDARLPQTERKNLAQAYVHRAMKLLQEAERRSVAASGASNVPDRSAQTLYDAACSYAMAAALARADVKQAERFAAHAVELNAGHPHLP